MTLTFTGGANGNWNVPQTVTINAARDADAINGTRDFLISALNYGTQILTATEIHTPDFVITPISSSIIEGTSVRFTVMRPAGVTGSVTVDLVKEAGGDLTSADISQFTLSDTNPIQTITITAAEDADTSNGLADFMLSAPGWAVGAFTATSLDNDVSPVVFLPDPISVPEGGFKVFDVKLAYQPIANVTVTITRVLGDTDLAFFDPQPRPTSITPRLPLLPTTGNTSQKLVFYAQKDADAETGNAVFDFTTTERNTLTKTLTVNEIDSNLGPIVVSTDSEQVLEGSSTYFTVNLPSCADCGHGWRRHCRCDCNHCQAGGAIRTFGPFPRLSNLPPLIGTFRSR